MAVSFIESGNATQGWLMRIYPPASYWVYCWAPISGSYCLLPRILFYCTIVFAAIGWGYKWLIAGALAASLLYSGQAAVHACLLAWSRRIIAENDIWALFAILSTAAILTVPLLNWSRSLRDLRLGKSDVNDGEGGDDDHNKKVFSKARTIIVYWGFLVVVGLFSLLIGLHAGGSVGFWAWVTPLKTSMPCVIYHNSNRNSTLRFQTTQLIHHIDKDGAKIEVPLIDADWANAHGCSNPCQTVARPAIFRTANDYQLLTVHELSRIEMIDEQSTEKDRMGRRFEKSAMWGASFTFPFIIAQGFWVTAFGRRSPTQIRDAHYILLRDFDIPSDYQPYVRTTISPRRKMVAKWLALISYTWSLFITIFCLPILALTIAAVEYRIHGLPESEPLIHVGSWAPWAGTALILIAALISQFHHSIIEALFGRKRKTSWRAVLQSIRVSIGKGFKNIGLPIWSFFSNTPKSEWQGFRRFCEDADSAKYYNRHGTELPAQLGQPHELDTNSETSQANVTPKMPRKSWWDRKRPERDPSKEAAEDSDSVALLPIGETTRDT